MGTIAAAPLLASSKLWASENTPLISLEDFSRELEGIAEDKAYWELVRSQFPLEKGFAYMNSGTRGAPPYPVVEVQRRHLEGNARKVGNFPREKALKSVAAFFNVKESELGFTHNTTEGINIIAQGLDLKSGDEIIMTTREHVGNALPWLNRCHQSKVRIRPFTPAHTPEGILEQIESLITRKTKAIAIPHITSPTGLVMPLEEICKLARDKGVLTAIDGAQSAGILNLDLHKIGVDFYAAGCHKWMLGPLGTGIIFVPERNLDRLKPLFVGAYSDTGWNLNENQQDFQGYVASAHRFDFGTQNGGLYQGVQSAVQFLETIGKEKVERRGRELGTYFFNKIQTLGDRIEMLSPDHPQTRGAMVGFRVKGIDYLHIADRCVKAKFRIRAVPESGLNSLRVSTHVFNSEQHVDDLVDFLGEMIRNQE